MERAGEETGIIPFQEYGNPDFGITDFIDNESNLDPLVDLITSQVFDSCDHDQHKNIGGGYLASEVFESDEVVIKHVGSINISPDCSASEEEEEESSVATTNMSSGKKMKNKSRINKADRLRTLISERKRRGRMKEKPYALRSLVPNITKMDKASIVGDAVLYVQDLQMQAKKLKSEIAGLHSSFTTKDYKRYSNKVNATSPNYPIIRKIYKVITEMDVFQVEERGFYVRLVSRKGKGVAAILYKALESLTSFTVPCSNLAASDENYVLAFTLHITEDDQVDMDLSSLKKFVTSVFINQGFDFETLAPAL